MLKTLQGFRIKNFIHITSLAQRDKLYVANKIALNVFYTVIKFLIFCNLVIYYFYFEVKSKNRNLVCKHIDKSITRFKTYN